MADFAVGDVQLPADFEQQIAAQLANASPNFAVQPSAGQTVEPPKEVDNFSVRTLPSVTYDPAAVQASMPAPTVQTGGSALINRSPVPAPISTPLINPQFDVNAYLNANPDLAANWQSGGVMRGLGSDLASAAQEHYNRTGQYEIAAGGRGGAPAFSAKTGMVTERGMGPNPDFAAKPTEIAPGVAYNPTGHSDASTPTVTASPSAPFDYSALKAGEPQLQPASGQYATPYYAAYTNDGDMAGAVMVAPGQKIRMVDPTNGDVVFEGEGPEGAKQAVAIANSLSQEKGRKAAWQIQAQNEQGGYTTQAAERYDPKKQGFLGKLADFALPILGTLLALPTGGLSLGLAIPGGAAVAAGLGAAAGSTLSSVAQGRNLKDTALRAGLSGLTAGLSQKFVTPALDNLLARGAASSVTSGGATPGIVSGLRLTTNAMEDFARGAGLSSVAPGFIDAASSIAARSALPSVIGASLPSGVANLVPTGSTISKDITPYTEAPNSGTDVEGVTVVADPKPSLTSVVGASVPGGVAGLVPTGSTISDNITPYDPKNNTLFDAMRMGGAGGALDWAKANPLDAASTALTLFNALGGGGGGGYGVGGTGAPGTRSSLGSVYSASLPAPSSRFAARQPNDMAGVDWKRYGMNPERSFFSTVPQNAADRLNMAGPATGAASGSNVGAASGAGYPAFAVVQNRLAMDSGRGPAPEGKRYIQRDDGAILLVDDSPEATYKGRSGATKKVRDLSVYQGGFTTKPISDFAAANLPEVIANLRSVGGLPMRRGGFAVQGDGDGREDAIPAKLSDGEYVIDAETVALLGNGSSKAGAAKLDKFRVNVRKHKGRDLAKGKFSASAKDPTAYLSGGRS